jgi:hypothetical protein
MDKTEYTEIKLYGKKNGRIKISHMENQISIGSPNAVLIGIDVRGDSIPGWNVSIPYENIDELIDNLKKMKEKNSCELNFFI